MTSTETHTEAERYARSIAAELRTWHNAACDDNDALNEIRDERPVEEQDNPPHVLDYLDAVALAVEVWRKDEDRDAVRVEITRTYGGPGCRIEWDSLYRPHYFTVIAYVAGEPEARVDVFAQQFGNQMTEVYE